MGWHGHILLGQNYFQWNPGPLLADALEATRGCTHGGEQRLSAPPPPPWRLPAAHNVGPKIPLRAVINSDVVSKPRAKAWERTAGNWTLPLKERNRETLFELNKVLSVLYHGACQNRGFFFCWISRPCFIHYFMWASSLLSIGFVFSVLKEKKKKKGLSDPIDKETKLCELRLLKKRAQ